MKKKIILFIIIICFIILYLLFYPFNNKKIKYVFLFIGDGMNLNHVEMTEIYNNVVNNTELEKQKELSFSKFETIGLRKNYDKYNYVPDSASSATALSSGFLTETGMLNMSSDGDKKEPITYSLKEKRKMKIGIVTTVPITHATPAAFYAYNNSRNNEYEIANYLVESNFDYFGNGGFSLDSDKLLDIENKLKKNDYKLVKTKEKIEKLNSKSGKVVAINPNNYNGTTNYYIDSDTHDLQLKDFVRKGIDVLDNKNGFFMMVESGMIDYASHNNDAKGVISEVNALDEAVDEALKFYNNHPNETLIIVTGDHETGGLSLGNSSGFGFELDKLKYQKVTFSKLKTYLNLHKEFKDILNYLDNNFGIGNDAYKFFLSVENQNKLQDYYNNQNIDGFINLVKEIIYSETRIGWSSDNHTASPVVVYSKGINSYQFGGKYTSVEFNQKLRKSLDV